MNQPANYRMPAEWEPQEAIWLSWPHNVETWPENLPEAQAEFSTLVRTIAETQKVMILASAEQIESHQSQIHDLSNVTWLPIPTNDAWARDYAPTFVKDSNDELVALDWRYNAWGGKYPPFDDDAKVAKLLRSICIANALHLIFVLKAEQSKSTAMAYCFQLQPVP